MHSIPTNSIAEMDGFTIVVIVLSIFCFAIIIVILFCYFYVFRNILCPPKRRSKRRRRENPRQGVDNPNRAAETISLDEFAQEESSMPTENSMATESDNI